MKIAKYDTLQAFNQALLEEQAHIKAGQAPDSASIQAVVNANLSLLEKWTTDDAMIMSVIESVRRLETVMPWDPEHTFFENAVINSSLARRIIVSYKNMNDEKRLLTIAETLALQDDGGSLMAFYDNFEISTFSEPDRLELALAIAKKGKGLSLSALAKFINKFNLSEELARLAVFRAIAERKEEDPLPRLVNGLNSFQLSEPYRLELMHAVLADNSYTNFANFLYCLDYFELSPADSLELANTLAERGMAVKEMADHFDKFQLANEDDRIRLADRIMESGNINALAANIEKFALSEKDRHRVANRIMESGNVGNINILASNIEKFALSETHQLRVVDSIIQSGNLDGLDILASNIEKFSLSEKD